MFGDPHSAQTLMQARDSLEVGGILCLALGVIVSDGDKLANGFVPIGMATFYPPEINRSFEETDEVRPTQVRTGYLEIRLSFKSLASDELHLPGHSGRIIAKYFYSKDHSQLISVP